MTFVVGILANVQIVRISIVSGYMPRKWLVPFGAICLFESYLSPHNPWFTGMLSGMIGAAYTVVRDAVAEGVAVDCHP